MKFLRSTRSSAPAPDASSPPVRRRAVVVGAGVAGAAAIAAAALHRAVAAPGPEVVAAPAGRPDEGYRETAHVLRYYETTRA